MVGAGALRENSSVCRGALVSEAKMTKIVPSATALNVVKLARARAHALVDQMGSRGPAPPPLKPEMFDHPLFMQKIGFLL